jgi:hypothetical protein
MGGTKGLTELRDLSILIESYPEVANSPEMEDKYREYWKDIKSTVERVS